MVSGDSVGLLSGKNGWLYLPFGPSVSTSLHIIPAQGYIVFYADGLSHLGPRHLNFSLSATGEFISLYGRDGQTVIDSLSFGSQVSDVSFGREFDGYSNWVFFSAPTPRASNNTAESFTGKSDPPVFSHKGGFYKETFHLVLFAASPGASIYYTLDGSEPDPDNLGGTTYYYKNNYPRHPETPFGELMLKSA